MPEQTKTEEKPADQSQEQHSPAAKRRVKKGLARRTEEAASKEPSKNGKPPVVKAEQQELTPEALVYRIRLIRDPDGEVRVLAYTPGKGERRVHEGSTLVAITEVDVGRPFLFHVPSSGCGPSGFVFEGFTGENARPWTAAQVLAGARFGMFGFSLVD